MNPVAYVWIGIGVLFMVAIVPAAISNIYTGPGDQADTFPQPAAWWKMDETAPGPVVDSAGTNDGTNDGAAIGAPGKFGTAYTFDGTDDRVEIPDDPTTDFTQTMTLSAWVNPTAFSGGSAVLTKERQYYLSIDPEGTVRLIFVQDPNVLGLETSIPVVSLNAWTHLAGTANGVDDLHIYINGAEANTNDIPGTFAWLADEPIYLGDAPAFPGFEFTGRLDDARIYQQTLTADQVRHIARGDTWTPAALNVWQILPFVIIAAIVMALVYRNTGGKGA